MVTKQKVKKGAEQIQVNMERAKFEREEDVEMVVYDSSDAAKEDLCLSRIIECHRSGILERDYKDSWGQ